MRLYFRLFLLLPSLWLTSSCNHLRKSETEIDSTFLNPSAVANPNQELLLAGSKYPIRVVAKEKEGRIEFSLINGHTTLETEEYIESPAAFSVVEAEGERYQPFLPLLRFPFETDSPMTWKGEIVNGEQALSATAKITSRYEELTYRKTTHNTIRVDVNLSLQEQPNADPLHRKIQFWFEPGHGMIMRNFGDTSVRRPAGF